MTHDNHPTATPTEMIDHLLDIIVREGLIAKSSSITVDIRDFIIKHSAAPSAQHDNHPNGATLISREQIEMCRSMFYATVPEGRKLDTANALCNMALASLARPLPSDMAEYVKLVRDVLIDAMIWCPSEDTNDAPCKIAEAEVAIDRIAAHLSLVNSALEFWANLCDKDTRCLESSDTHAFGAVEGISVQFYRPDFKFGTVEKFTQALRDARALIPAGQQTKGQP